MLDVYVVDTQLLICSNCNSQLPVLSGLVIEYHCDSIRCICNIFATACRLYVLNTLNSQVMGTWLLLCSHLGNLETKVNAKSNSTTFSTTTANYKLYINICLFSGFALTLLFTDTACLAFEVVLQSPLKWTIFNLNESNIGVLKFWQIGNTMKMSLFFQFYCKFIEGLPHTLLPLPSGKRTFVFKQQWEAPSGHFW